MCLLHGAAFDDDNVGSGGGDDDYYLQMGCGDTLAPTAYVVACMCGAIQTHLPIAFCCFSPQRRDKNATGPNICRRTAKAIYDECEQSRRLHTQDNA